MSRAAYAGPITTMSQPIFTTQIIGTDGKKSRVMSAQALSDDSIHINAPQVLLNKNKEVVGTQIVSGALYLLYRLCARDLSHPINKKEIPYSFAWINIFGFIFGFRNYGELENVGQYVVALVKPSLFPSVKMHPFYVIDAVMRGEEDIVMNVLRADPSYLLRKAVVKNSVGVEYEVTPLAAAIMTTDIQMVEKMREHFARLTKDLEGNPIDGMTEFNRQIKGIYKKNLQKYLSLQKIKIASLETQQEYGHLKDQVRGHVIGQEQHRYNLYWNAFKSDDIEKIVGAHNQAQENNAFDFNSYIDAILNAPQAELDDVMAMINAKTPEETAAVIARTGVDRGESDECRGKPFDDLTLVQKLNRFREKLKEHMQHEMIFNPHHILAGLKANDEVWDTLPHNQDPNYIKRSIIFSWLCGEAQRLAAEPVKQDIRQGTWYLTEENERRSRQSRFNDLDASDNIVRNSFVDGALVNSSVVGGLGYKFGGSGGAGPWSAGALTRSDVVGPVRWFSKLMSSKNIKLSELILPRVPRSHCIVQ